MNWKVLNSKELFKSGVFRLRVDECELPDGRIMPRYYTLEFPDWVNVVPITSDGQIIMIDQYRHSAEGIFTEVPGGSTHGKDEDPKDAAQRELLEETGYASERLVYCGSHYPNPALQTNQMHTFLALDCKKIADPQLDPFEDIQVKMMSIKEAYQWLDQGKIKHSLIAASMSLARSHLVGLGWF